MELSITHHRAGMLKRALLANAAFSGLSGLLIVVFQSKIAALSGFPGLALWPVGVVLMGFSAHITWLATRTDVDRTAVGSIIASDFAWVIATPVVLWIWRDSFTPAGLWLLIGVGLVVLIFAELQWVGMRRLSHARQIEIADT